MSIEIKNDIITKMQEMETRVEILHTLLSGYITDMKGYVAPEIESQMMRVDRNDIWYNMMQIEGEVENASYGFNPPYHSEPDYQYGAGDIVRGAGDAIVGMLDGIWSLALYLTNGCSSKTIARRNKWMEKRYL